MFGTEQVIAQDSHGSYVLINLNWPRTNDHLCAASGCRMAPGVTPEEHEELNKRIK
jgi:hypothetical protein